MQPSITVRPWLPPEILLSQYWSCYLTSSLIGGGAAAQTCLRTGHVDNPIDRVKLRRIDGAKLKDRRG
jgi:hypothetical protein